MRAQPAVRRIRPAHQRHPRTGRAAGTPPAPPRLHRQRSSGGSLNRPSDARSADAAIRPPSQRTSACGTPYSPLSGADSHSRRCAPPCASSIPSSTANSCAPAPSGPSSRILMSLLPAWKGRGRRPVSGMRARAPRFPAPQLPGRLRISTRNVVDVPPIRPGTGELPRAVRGRCIQRRTRRSGFHGRCAQGTMPPGTERSQPGKSAPAASGRRHRRLANEPP